MGTDDHGVSDRVRRSPLAALLDGPELSAPTKHYALGIRRMDKRLCGASDGWETLTRSSVTCPECRKILAARDVKVARSRKKRAA